MCRFETMVDQRPPLSRDEPLYRIGDQFTAIYAVKSGSLKTLVSTQDGENQITGFYLPGELFGFDGFDDNHSCSAVALERSNVCELPLDSIEELSSHIPSLRRELDRLMGRQINSDQSMLLLLSRRSADERLATFLVSLSIRFQQRGLSANEFRLSMSRHDIANYLGLAAKPLAACSNN